MKGQLLALAIAVASLLLIVTGIALIYLPAALIAGGIAGLALITFDPARARRMTWPR